MFKEFTFIVKREIPEGTPRHERNWPKWKPKFVTLGEKNAEALRKHIVDVYPDAINVDESSSTRSTPIYTARTLGAGSEWNPTRFNLISLGSSRTCRGEYTHDNFTCEEYQEEANQVFEAKQTEEARRENSYYSQPWV